MKEERLWMDQDMKITEHDYRMKHAELEDKYEGKFETMEEEIARLKELVKRAFELDETQISWTQFAKQNDL